MSCEAKPYYIESTGIVALGDPTNPTGTEGLRDALADAYVNDADSVSVVAVTDDETGAAISGITIPVSMEYLEDSNGVYTGKLPAAAEIAQSQRFTIKIVAIKGTDTATFFLDRYGERAGFGD